MRAHHEDHPVVGDRMTDPTPIAADPHVSGGVEEREPDWHNAETCIENMQIAYDDALEADPFDDGNSVPVHTVVDAGDLGVLIDLARYATRHRLAAVPVPANAEGVREAAARAAYESWYKGGQYAWENERGQKDLWYRIIDAVSPILTTRPTDTAARDEGVVRDAARWRALWSSDRIRMMGCAGFDFADDGSVKLREDDWQHMGIEVWDRHPAQGDREDTRGRTVLLAYVDARVAAASETNHD